MTFNKIKEYFKNIYNNIVISNDQPMLDRIKEQDKIISILENLNKELNETITAQQNTIKEKDELIASLDYRTEEEKQLETFWNNKYNKGIIRYLGRSYPFSTTKIKFPLNVLLTPNDPDIIEDLKKWKLYRTGEDPETLAPKIYKKVFQTYYRYLYDKEVWNENEVWEMSFEMYEKIREKLKKNEIAGFDCDSWGCFLNSFYIAAGIPRWRVRSVAGMTVLGGHYTCHLYSMVDNKWHHLNSTYGGTFHNKISDYPLITDARNPTNNTGNDIIGLYNIWFSFNDLYMWYSKAEDIPKELQLTKVK